MLSIRTVFLILFLVVVVAVTANAQLVGTITDVVEPVGASGKVDWSTGVITAVGIGAPPAQPANASRSSARAPGSLTSTS